MAKPPTPHPKKNVFRLYLAGSFPLGAAKVPDQQEGGTDGKDDHGGDERGDDSGDPDPGG